MKLDQVDLGLDEEVVAQMTVTLREWMVDETIIAPLTRLTDEELVRLARAIGVALIFSQTAEGPRPGAREALAYYDGEPLLR